MSIILDFLNKNLDKVVHFQVGYMLATIFPILPMYGLAIAMICGFLKEVYDYFHPDKHTCDKWDMIATWAGGLLGIISLIIKG